jgi:hypothetical protein
MKFRDRVLIAKSSRLPLIALFLPGMLALGCVDLTKPELVKKYCSSGSSEYCNDNGVLPTPDSGEPGPDVKEGDEPVAPSGPEVGPETQSQPDAGVDVVDAPSDKKDLAGPEAKDTTGPEVSGPEVSSPPDSPIDTAVINDVGPDLGPDLSYDSYIGPDSAPDVSPPGTDAPSFSSCTAFYGSSPSKGSSGHPPAIGNTGATCIVTCDPVAGWGCSNMENRTVSVNGAAATGTCGGAVTAKGGYFVFQISGAANANPSATIYWWTTNGVWASSCPAPDGGLLP